MRRHALVLAAGGYLGAPPTRTADAGLRAACDEPVPTSVRCPDP